ncbi:SHOCT domain-containing protein [Cellulosimicrobium sp. NPDC057862]|uniref:SHOCT domain-containing protein n=1 Tax=Cellulosimicrobium sp. NPDC057862 TaxID=3346266 RepID=UPI0036720070
MDGTTMVEVTVLGPVALPAADLAELGVHRTAECTLLEATVRDQAALYGLLQRLAALGLDLLELRTAAPGQRADVEVVVRGPVGALVQQMLRDVGRALPASLTSYRLRDTDLSGLLAVVAGLRSPAAGDEASPTAPPAAPAAPSSDREPVADPAPDADATAAMDVTISQLRELAALRDQGVLTDAELAEQKARILGR